MKEKIGKEQLYSSTGLEVFYKDNFYSVADFQLIQSLK